MAIIAGVKDFDVTRRNDFPLTLTFKGGDGNALNLTGFTVDAEVYSITSDGFRDTKYADWSITYTNRSTGIVDIALTDTQTTTFNKHELKYDVQLTQPNGDKFQYIRGTLYINEGYSEWVHLIRLKLVRLMKSLLLK